MPFYGFTSLSSDLTGRFSERLARVVRVAERHARLRSALAYEAQDLLTALLAVETGVGLAAVERCVVEPSLLAALAASPPAPEVDPRRGESSPRPSDEVEAVLARAASEARAMGHGYLGTEHLVLGLIGVPGTTAERAMSKTGLTLVDLRRRVIEFVGVERVQ